MVATTAGADERIARLGLLRRLLLKPELGALIGAVLIFVFFSSLSDVFWSFSGVANWLDLASNPIGIMAVAVALLMIGGHFDLSAGTMVGTAGLATAILTQNAHTVIWVAMLESLILCLAIGFLNGFLVVRTGLPSFIITLSTFLGLQGLNVGLTKLITNTVQVQGIDKEPYVSGPHALLASNITIAGQPIPIAVFWWLLFTAVGSWVLFQTRFGNWIFAIGGDKNASRNVGVPAARTTIILFMTVSFAAWFAGNTIVLRFNSIQAVAGVGQELVFIVAAVIGGCLLTGGFGSVVGASIGALIFGMTSAGIVYANWDSDWFRFFLGGMLLVAVLANQFVRGLGARRRSL
ncbi:ABC transporter permease [Actinoplanes subtropicus]|uniref:ABC transporter permease n=1 Tax=Actinoplanes subtropicus TaxID=543632 RepID=UPI0004C396B2|nr:ABC transporter permease [Actinoplanes subtropicus]